MSNARVRGNGQRKKPVPGGPGRDSEAMQRGRADVAAGPASSEVAIPGVPAAPDAETKVPAPAENAPGTEMSELQMYHAGVGEHDCANEYGVTRNWCFTWNNYTEDDCKSIESWVTPEGLGFRCVMYGREVGASGTPHLQGFFVAHTVKSFSSLKKVLPAALHIEKMKGRIEHNVKYCTKDGTGIVLLGELPMSSKEKGAAGVAGGPFGHLGKQFATTNSNWAALQRDAAAGLSLKECSAKYPAMFGQYHKGFLSTWELHRPDPEFHLGKKHSSLYAWQRALLEIVARDAHDRHVIWVWSAAGNVGKTAMCKHLCSQNGFTMIGNGATRDMTCAWKCGNTVVDIARSETDEVNYGFIEKAKDGMVFSSKYLSGTKIADGHKPCHVVCFANEAPKIERLSLDRWQIYTIGPDMSWKLATIAGGVLYI